MTDVISDAIHQNDTTHVTYRIGNNLNTYDAFDLLLALTLHPTMRWTTIGALDIVHDHYFGQFQGAPFDMANFVGIFNVSNTFRLKYGWEVEMTFFYRSQNIDAVLLESPYFKMDAGIRKRFAHDRGSINLNCSDIFWSDWFTATENFQNVNFIGKRYSDSRRARITLTWKLGKSQYQREEKRRGAEEEMNRIKSK
jgi:hypothetical protein